MLPTNSADSPFLKLCIAVPTPHVVAYQKDLSEHWLLLLQASAAMAAAAAQQGFPGQPMGPPSHASPMLSGPASNGDPVMAQPPGGLGVRPPMGIMPPGSSSPTVNPAMQPFAGGAPPGTASQQSQQQQQLILTKMQQCMTNTQKLQQMLNSGDLRTAPASLDLKRQLRTSQSPLLPFVTLHYSQAKRTASAKL